MSVFVPPTFATIWSILMDELECNKNESTLLVGEFGANEIFASFIKSLSSKTSEKDNIEIPLNR